MPSGAYVSFEEMVAAFKEDLRRKFFKDLPFAVVMALTRTAVICRDLMKQHIRSTFDRATPYAANAARAVPATKARMASAVLLREFGGGTPAEYFLGPQIDGGGRRRKRTEKSLAAAGFLQPGGFATPGAGAALDQYGNQSRGEVVKILSVLRAFGEQGYRANRAKAWSKKTRAGQIFAVRAGSNRPGLKPGVYRRTTTGVVPLMIFVNKPPTYRARLPFEALVLADAQKVFPVQIEKAMREVAFGKEGA